MSVNTLILYVIDIIYAKYENARTTLCIWILMRSHQTYICILRQVIGRTAYVNEMETLENCGFLYLV